MVKQIFSFIQDVNHGFTVERYVEAITETLEAEMNDRIDLKKEVKL